jgi:hypothetical protein
MVVWAVTVRVQMVLMLQRQAVLRVVASVLRVLTAALQVLDAAAS